MDIRDYSGQELLERLDSGKLSVLDAIGAHDLKKEMIHVGRLCSFVVRLVCLNKDDSTLRKKAAGVIRFAAPACLRHRAALNFEAVTAGKDMETVLAEIMAAVAEK